MSFVLISRTRGDELIRPTEKVVAKSEYRGVLENLRHERATERAHWLARSSVPWFQECGLIASEEIEEFEEVPDLP